MHRKEKSRYVAVYEPKSTIEKIGLRLAGVKKASNTTLPPQELNAVTNY